MGMEPFGWTRWHGGNPEGFLKNLGPNAAENGQTPDRGLKPTATIIESLRDLSEMSKLQAAASRRRSNVVGD